MPSLKALRIVTKVLRSSVGTLPPLVITIVSALIPIGSRFRQQSYIHLSFSRNSLLMFSRDMLWSASTPRMSYELELMARGVDQKNVFILQ
jgi:hypothetical protein